MKADTHRSLESSEGAGNGLGAFSMGQRERNPPRAEWLKLCARRRNPESKSELHSLLQSSLHEFKFLFVF